jgi:bifunctional non-homologous end joining protein LigD
MMRKKTEGSLTEYQKEHDFAPAPERRSRPQSVERMNRFVVHKHSARSAQYDLRLEMDDHLRCWAIPKGPPLRAGVRRLAIPTENHPLEYLAFEGTIPSGAGLVEIWDTGTFKLDPRSALENELKLVFYGTRLKGLYALIKTTLGDGSAWLCIKLKQK